MTHTARTSVIAHRFYTIFAEEVVGNEALFAPLPTIMDVYYGDQNKIPRAPAICIEPGAKGREWPPKPNLMTQNDFEIHFLIYHARLDQSIQDAKYQADLLGELVEEYINIQHTRLQDADGNDLIIHGHVVGNDPGYINRGASQWHATHLTWRGISKTQLTVAG
jgi:hypothetical protein